MNKIVIPDLTTELNGIKGRLEALEQKVYSMKMSREDHDREQQLINLKGLVTNG